MAYSFYMDNVLLPITPAKVSIKINNKNKTVNLINQGEINLIKTPGLTEISFECILPHNEYPFATYVKGKQKTAQDFLDKFQDLKERKKVPFQFIIFRPSNKPPEKKSYFENRVQRGKESVPTEKVEEISCWFDTNMTVTLEDYDIVEDASNGSEVVVSINLKEFKDYSTKHIKETPKKTNNSKKITYKVIKSRIIAPAKTKQYTVKSGDNLWAIAKKYLGNGAKSNEIYKLNKATIEKAAKAHGKKSSSKGWWIYPGTKLNIPS